MVLCVHLELWDLHLGNHRSLGSFLEQIHISAAKDLWDGLTQRAPNQR